MKGMAELKFDKVVKEGFHAILKPLGFRKKGNNFYRQREDMGQSINLQKSRYYSKDHIHFTINTGVFLPEFWTADKFNFGKPLPDFPTEPDCIFRKRIGELRKQNDTWFDVTPETDDDAMIQEMKVI